MDLALPVPGPYGAGWVRPPSGPGHSGGGGVLSVVIHEGRNPAGAPDVRRSGPAGARLQRCGRGALPGRACLCGHGGA